RPPPERFGMLSHAPGEAEHPESAKTGGIDQPEHGRLGTVVLLEPGIWLVLQIDEPVAKPEVRQELALRGEADLLHPDGPGGMSKPGEVDVSGKVLLADT